MIFIIFQKLSDLRSGFLVVLATESGRPVAYSADGIEGELVRAGVLGADHLAVHHSRAGDEFLARRWMSEVSLIEASDSSLACHEQLVLELGLYDQADVVVVDVVVVVDYCRSSGPGRHDFDDSLVTGPLSSSDQGSRSRGRRRLGSRRDRRAYLSSSDRRSER